GGNDSVIIATLMITRSVTNQSQVTAAVTFKRNFRNFLESATITRVDPTWIVRLDAPGEGPRLAVKDCIDVAGLPTTVGCEVIAEQASPAAQDAAVVVAARRAGARIVGKTNLTELCWSAAGVNSWSGTPANPVDPR